jgi:outer membrane protein assembly factor BamD (BamD/ComL family)
MNNRLLRCCRMSPRNGLKAVALLCACWGGGSGCKTGLDLSALRQRDDEQIRQMADADDVRGPLQRFLEAGGFNKEKRTLYETPPSGMQEYDRGMALLKAGELKDAEKTFERVAKLYKNAPVREDALFMAAEAQFRQQRYSWADDNYGRVAKEFPSTRYLDSISERRFEIARIWLGFPDVVTSSDIQPVNFDDPDATPLPKSTKPAPKGISYNVPVIPNVFDRTRPVFDTKGRALVALKSIWLNDPTGPLADDALMLTASHYLREGDHVEADRIYATLRQEYPKSRHLENAFVLGSHVKLMSYQGAAYDGTSLEEARKLRESTLRLYPDNPDRERLLDEIRKIEELEAQRDWEDVVFYQKKGKPRAAAIMCKQVIHNHPNSEYAMLAREALAKIAPADKSNVIPNPYDIKPEQADEPESSGRTRIFDENAPNEFTPDEDANSIDNEDSFPGDDPF